MAVNWLPLHIRDVEFGYEENPLFKNFDLSLSHKGFYRISSKGHINAPLFLLRFLAGLTRPSRGEFYSGDNCLSDMSFEEFLPWAQNMGYSFESGGLLSNKTVKENLLLPLQYHQRAPLSECLTRVDSMIQRYDLVSCQDSRPANIPPSDYKMVVLVRAIIHYPKILLLAAPEEGLEPSRFLKFSEQIKELMASGVLELVMYTSQTNFNFSKDHQFEIQIEPRAAHLGEVA